MGKGICRVFPAGITLIIGDDDAHILHLGEKLNRAVDLVWPFQDAAHVIDQAAQIAMEVDFPAEAVDRIEDRAVAARGVSLHDREQGVQAMAAVFAAGPVISPFGPTTSFLAPWDPCPSTTAFRCCRAPTLQDRRLDPPALSAEDRAPPRRQTTFHTTPDQSSCGVLSLT